MRGRWFAGSGFWGEGFGGEVVQDSFVEGGEGVEFGGGEQAGEVAADVAGSILLFPQGVVPAALKLAHAHERIWFLPLYLPQPLQWPACFVMIKDDHSS